MFVQADGTGNATIEVYSSSNTYGTFQLAGYWSTPPGTFTEAHSDLGSPTVDNTWQDKDLSGFGVPADAVAEITVEHLYSSTANQIGVRTNLQRHPSVLRELFAEHGSHAIQPGARLAVVGGKHHLGRLRGNA